MGFHDIIQISLFGWMKSRWKNTICKNPDSEKIRTVLNINSLTYYKRYQNMSKKWCGIYVRLHSCEMINFLLLSEATRSLSVFIILTIVPHQRDFRFAFLKLNKSSKVFFHKIINFFYPSFVYFFIHFIWNSQQSKPQCKIYFYII